MPDKFCELCGERYWARWRNTPGVCSRCTERAVVCPDCWKVQSPLPDPAQLSLFSPRALPLGVRPLSAVMASHFANHRLRNWDHEEYAERLLTTEPAKHPEPVASWPRRASLAERRKYPFH